MSSFNLYFTLQVMIVAGFCALMLTTFLYKTFLRPLCATQELKLHYAVLKILILILALQPFLPQRSSLQPVVRVWSAPTMKAVPQHPHLTTPLGTITVPIPNSTPLLPSAVLFIGFLLWAFFLFREIQILHHIHKHSFRIRHVRSISIYICSQIAVPFSYWRPGATIVMLPQSLAVSGPSLQIALKHELQHHRQGDTLWLYLLGFLKILCFANPFIYLWTRKIAELQEFACDETLVDRNKVKSQQYVHCLMEVAQNALSQKHTPACATGLLFLTKGSLLKRRIEKMIQSTKAQKAKRSMLIFTLTCTAALMGAVAFASRDVIQDRRVTEADAQALVERLPQSNEFPLIINDLVLQKLNRFMGTVDGRQYIKHSLERMEQYRTLITAKLREYNVPQELMAIPIIESGYKNLPQSGHQGWGAGVWMFIKSTAHNYGLRVDNEQDERLNLELETDAAMRLLVANRTRFNDWRLSVLAYNAGENAVQKAINTTGSRDPWVLVRYGFNHESEEVRSYLPKLMAAILIMHNPESVE